MTIDTACSSSMVALELACNGLWNGTSDLALVCGANLIYSPELNISLSNMGFLSPDGTCFSFDHRANGYARGEGFAVLVLKRKSSIKPGDPVRALVRSIATNEDGRTSAGITQPSKDMQIRLIQEAYNKAGMDMNATAYFEAHGMFNFFLHLVVPLNKMYTSRSLTQRRNKVLLWDYIIMDHRSG